MAGGPYLVWRVRIVTGSAQRVALLHPCHVGAALGGSLAPGPVMRFSARKESQVHGALIGWVLFFLFLPAREKA